jgi:hypothetical protein
VKSIHVTFEDTEFQALLKAKGKTSWHDFIYGFGGKALAKGEGRKA